MTATHLVVRSILIQPGHRTCTRMSSHRLTAAQAAQQLASRLLRHHRGRCSRAHAVASCKASLAGVSRTTQHVGQRQAHRGWSAEQAQSSGGFSLPCYGGAPAAELAGLASVGAATTSLDCSVSSSSNGSSTSSTTGSSGQPHVPVLLEEVLGCFCGRPLAVYVDATLGAGGHACAVIQDHPEVETFVGFDQDASALAIAAPRIAMAAQAGLRAHLLQQNFRNLGAALHGINGGLSGRVDGMLLDLGVSSMQVDTAERGFSFMRDGPLDMRMGAGASASAADLVNTWPEADLARIFRDYGEDRHWRKIAARVVDARGEGWISTTRQLVAAIGFPGGRPAKGRGIHPATRVFQALRIAVNDELGALEAAIPAAVDALAPGGRLGVISFHSLEDRIVKRAFLAAAGRARVSDTYQPQGWRQPDVLQKPMPPLAHIRILTKRPITAGSAELAANARSSSAKLRFVEKL